MMNLRRIGRKIRPMWFLRTKEKALKKKALSPWRRISKDIQEEEHQRFTSLLSKFPKIFINEYLQIRGVDIIKHHIDLKEVNRLPKSFAD